MFRIETGMKDRYCSILLQGIPVVELKVKTVTDDEVIGVYGDGEEIHINQSAIVAYWPDQAKDMKARKRADKKKAKMTVDSL